MVTLIAAACSSDGRDTITTTVPSTGDTTATAVAAPLEAIYEIIRVGVNNGELGRGAAQSVMLFVAVIGITVWQFKTSGERVSYGGS